GASTTFGAAPNSHASVIDVALPGTLPVLNGAAVERAIRFGLAIGATIAPRSVFARKNYFYPDLPKGYQISQYEIPVVQGGSLSFVVQPKSGDAYMKTIRLTRAHLEEDAGKSLHEGMGSHAALGHGMSGIDLNRAGTPLLEIVSEPDIRVTNIAGAAAEAIAYAKALHSLVVWLGICDGNMQEGSFRCDANVSVRPAGSTELGTRCEIKNLNSFRFMQQAIEFEARRQIDLIEDGGTVVQETRLYDPDRDETRSMRSKEDAMDYRYFPDPDLLPLEITAQWIERVRAELPELPGAMRERFVGEYGLSEYDAQTLTDSRSKAAYYEATARQVSDKKLAANWVMGEVSSALNDAGLSFDECPVSPVCLAGILNILVNGEINAKGAKILFAKRCALGDKSSDVSVPLTGQEMTVIQGELRAMVEEHGLGQISDAVAIEKIVDEVLAANLKSVEEFRAGKEKAFNALVGQAMKATQGKANPQQLNEILRRRLAG
ncbi:MAG TPA: Asp-tRNA(Asn)/Glu-tRNA(Gln) amidotransferase subunit GatB, partial [Burkholderiaceae bacterium]|nr:Asp-tRNA(Asn)/Glu-tRNA(Gln) amidotransferase subunit GatB [Burkholderiaceae bacterium]